MGEIAIVWMMLILLDLVVYVTLFYMEYMESHAQKYSDDVS